MMYGVNQVKCVISYKDPITLEEKFKEFPIERTEPRETFEFMLENLTEGQYDFSIVTYDPKNNTSIPTEVSACLLYTSIMSLWQEPLLQLKTDKVV